MKSNKTYRKIKIKLMNLPRDDHKKTKNIKKGIKDIKT